MTAESQVSLRKTLQIAHMSEAFPVHFDILDSPGARSEHCPWPSAFIRGKVARIKFHCPKRTSVRLGWGVSVQICQ